MTEDKSVIMTVTKIVTTADGTGEKSTYVLQTQAKTVAIKVQGEELAQRLGVETLDRTFRVSFSLIDQTKLEVDE